MSFTDGKRWIASEKDCRTSWGLNGDGFRCGLCGHRFKPGDGVRWQHGAGRQVVDENGKSWGVCNFKVCDACDCPDVLDKWVALHEEYLQPKFWTFRS